MNTDKTKSPFICVYLCSSVVLFLIGCHQGNPTSITSDSHELTQNPRILLESPQEWADLTVHGIRIGDVESRINPNKIDSRNEKSGWTILRDSNRYRTKDGVIDALGMWDQKLIGQLGIATEGDIPAKFGKPEDKVQIPQNNTAYFYQGGHIHVLWNSFEKRVVGVDIMK
jgi:hypothetical protein